MWIVIEGADGSGKTTTAMLLVDRLNSLDRKAIYVANPGTSELGIKIRDIIKTQKLTPLEYTYLFSGVMCNLINEFVIPAEDTGDIIIMDRWCRSTFIYQGFYENFKNTLSKDFNKDRLFGWITEYSLLAKRPDYEFVLMIDPEVAWKRCEARDGAVKDPFEGNGYEWFKNIHNQYAAMVDDKSLGQTFEMFNNPYFIPDCSVESRVNMIMDQLRFGVSNAI